MPLESDTGASPAPEQEIQADVVDTTQADQNSPELASDGVDAGSPAADEKPKSLLDVVTNVLEPKAPEDTSASDPVKEEPGEATAEGEEPSEEDDAKLPFGKHPRWKKVLGERNELRTENSTIKAQLEELKGPADQYTRIEGFLRTNSIEGEEFVRLMHIGALVKNDPEKARTELINVLLEIDEATGRKLPADIQADIEAGRMTEERGLELSQTRAREAQARERADAATATAERVSTETQTREAVQAITSRVATWEANLRSTDPDFAAKDQLVADKVAAANARLGQPKSPEEAVQRCQEAYEAVTAHLLSLQPKKAAVTTSPKGGSITNVAPAPTNLRQAVDAALSR